MCEIDRELVRRAAAHFATYAHEQQPPHLDQFTAQLIARALRNRVAKLEPIAPAAPPPPPSAGGRRMALIPPGKHGKEIVDFLRHRTDGMDGPGIADALGIRIGNIYFFLNALVAEGFIVKGEDDRFRVTGKPTGADDPLVKRAIDILTEKKILQGTRTDGDVRMLCVFLQEPDRVFANTEICEAVGIDSHRHGNFRRVIIRFVKTKIVDCVAPGRFRLARGIA